MQLGRRGILPAYHVNTAMWQSDRFRAGVWSAQEHEAKNITQTTEKANYENSANIV